jgi:hypothetical protein
MTACSSCPFMGSETSERAINYGCVPDPYEIMSLKDNENINWSCHSANQICAGFVTWCKQENIDYKSGKPITYQDWFEGKKLDEEIACPYSPKEYSDE